MGIGEDLRKLIEASEWLKKVTRDIGRILAEIHSLSEQDNKILWEINSVYRKMQHGQQMLNRMKPDEPSRARAEANVKIYSGRYESLNKRRTDIETKKRALITRKTDLIRKCEITLSAARTALMKLEHGQ